MSSPGPTGLAASSAQQRCGVQDHAARPVCSVAAASTLPVTMVALVPEVPAGGTRRWCTGGAEDGFVGTHQLVIDMAEGGCRPAYGRHHPPGRRAPLPRRCHCDHLFVMQDGLLLRPPVLDRRPLRNVSMHPVEDWWRTPGVTGARTHAPARDPVAPSATRGG